MKKFFVDTNFFLRFLLKDIQNQHIQAKKLLLEGAEEKIELFTSLIVIFELYWVLTSFYQKNKKKVAKIILNILKLKFIDLEEREILIHALKIYSNSNLDFEDSYNLVYALTKKADKLATFDKRLEKIFEKEKS